MVMDSIQTEDGQAETSKPLNAPQKYVWGGGGLQRRRGGQGLVLGLRRGRSERDRQV